jgi:dsRNA-specific ribonuclease
VSILIRKELIDFFKLENDHKLFELAIKSTSCSENEEFKFMALLGDSLLKLCLFEILSDKLDTKDTGKLTKQNIKFHNKKTLDELSRNLGITNLMIPIVKIMKFHRKMLRKLLNH